MISIDDVYDFNFYGGKREGERSTLRPIKFSVSMTGIDLEFSLIFDEGKRKRSTLRLINF